MKKLFLFGLYQCITLLLLPFFLLFILSTMLKRPIYRKNMGQRFGFYPPDFFQSLRGKTVFWVHAASVGEVMMSRLFVQSLKQKYPEAGIVFSTITPTGQVAAREHLSKVVTCFIYFPFDFFWVAARVIKKISPALFIFMETEIWPNCLRSLSKMNIPAVMVNGRISTKSFPGYQKLRAFIALVLKEVPLFLVQSRQDADRLMALGALSNRVEVTGNMKYDQAGKGEGKQADTDQRFASLGLNARIPILLAGSTRPGEEDAILEVFRTMRLKIQDLVLIMAPRHLVRLDKVERIIESAGFQSIRKGKIAGSLVEEERAAPVVILVDTLGELSGLYSLAKFVFVGGSLAPFGGHNPLEAAACKKPVFFGPHMENFLEVSTGLIASGGGLQVTDGKALAERMIWLHDAPEEYEQRAQAAYEEVLKHRGAVQRNLERIEYLLDRV